MKEDRKVMILGTEYTIKEMKHDDEQKSKLSGYIHLYDPIIIIDYNGEKSEIKHTLKHEVVHAFKHESGLRTCEVQSDEQNVDWIANQFNKIMKVYKELKIL
jgi:Zn-dependent peptidase ImmA (M78 family)